ncbi:T9SS type A sorting domain-containing protein [Coprobacter tertius]|uniref:T9SS type A sorting domain-containing protein n=1 Tax=Coprobacter tertius TaxID=2944915 RepID=A0ABT1ML44_9BACT|nr:T9SS type A sorting domain-containing protein [Coprobacter tertius]MCP9612774.1 T9SS type A sorting domain-containing protein [Coprobacter tertius]
MKSITSIGKRVFTLVVFAWCAITVFAQDQIFNFNTEEVADYAAFFKQPSAIEGKCNAEVMGIDIHREGFSWDDMNTWKNAEGQIWRSYTPSYAETVFGLCVKMDAPFNGKTSTLTWTNTEGDNKWYPALPAVQNLKGNFVLRDCKATVVHISNTQLDTVKIAMTNEENDCYLHIRRNPYVKQIDLSGSTGKCRQLEGYKNILSDETSFICNDCRKTEFLDWLLNLEDNCYTYSTLPMHPATGEVLKSGYKSQWKTAGGYPVGIKNESGEYEIEVDEDIDLSSEYDILGQLTTFTWKNEGGDVITPTSEDLTGWFSFGDECVGNSYRCEMQNAAYPQLALNTVWVRVVKNSGINTVQEKSVTVGPNPVEDVIYVSSPDVRRVDIYSTAGARVKSMQGVQKVNVADLASGLYFVKVITATDEIVLKIIKK